MSHRGRRYLSYLLRLWQAQGDAGPEWRASLESAETGEPRGFGSLEELLAFLEERTRKEGEAHTESPAEPPTV